LDLMQVTEQGKRPAPCIKLPACAVLPSRPEEVGVAGLHVHILQASARSLCFALWSCHKPAILRQACNAVASSIMDLYGHSSERTYAGVTASPPSPVSRAADTLPCKKQSMACAAWPLVLHWATHHLDTALVAAVHCGACSDACTRASPPLGPRF